MSFFFIHNYKVAGTTIYQQLPKEYNKRFYGYMRFSKYERKNKIILDETTKKELIAKDKKISIDHIHIDHLVKLGIISAEEVAKTEFLFLFRHPVSRFLSICNYEKISPTKMIENFKQNRRLELRQSFWIKSRYPLSLTTLRVEDKKEIANWFARFGIGVNLDKKRNVTRRIFPHTENDLTNEQLDYLYTFFEEDFDHYHSLQNRYLPGDRDI